MMSSCGAENSKRTHPAILANMPLPMPTVPASQAASERQQLDHLSTTSYLGELVAAAKYHANHRTHLDHHHEQSLEQALEDSSAGVSDTTRPVVERQRHEREIRELEGELERILQQHLGEHDKINLSFYLNEFETGACNLADLLGFLIGRLLITLPNPVIRYRLLVCIKRLYVEPRLASGATATAAASSSSSSSSWTARYPYGGPSVGAAPAVDSGQLDLRLFEATCRRCLLASSSLLSEGRLQELERDELRRRRRQRRAAELRRALDPPDSEAHSAQNKQHQEQELMLRRDWRRRKSSDCNSQQSASHFMQETSSQWPTTTRQLLKPALPVARQAQLAHHWRAQRGQSDPPPQLVGHEDAIVAGNANNPQGVYFPSANSHHWLPQSDPRRQPEQWHLSSCFQAESSSQLAATRLKWLSAKSDSLNHRRDATQEEAQEEEDLPWCTAECDEPASYIDGYQWGHLHDYSLSYGPIPGDNESQLGATSLRQTASHSGSVQPVHDNGISNSLNTHPPPKLTHLNHTFGPPTTQPRPFELLEVASHQHHLPAHQPEPAFPSTSITPLTNNNNNSSYYYNYNNAAWPSHNDAAGSEPLPSCCSELAMANCRLCQLNQVDGRRAPPQTGATPPSHLQQQQDTVPRQERQLEAISINEIYPQAPYHQSRLAHKLPGRPPPPGTPRNVAGGHVSDAPEGALYCGQLTTSETVVSMAADNCCLPQQEGPHSYSSGARIRAPTSSKHQVQPLPPPASITGSDKLVALSSSRSHRPNHHSHRHHQRSAQPSSYRVVDQWLGCRGIQQKDYWLREAAGDQVQELEENEDPADEVLLVPAQARNKLPMSVAEQMKRQADSFVNQYNRAGGAAKPDRRHKPSLQVRRTLKVRIKKSKPILGIAIEGGFNVSGQLLPRIVCVHEQGSAYQCGKLRASDLILEVNGKSTVNMTHDEIARTIATAYYQSDCPYIEFLIGESVQTG